SLFPFPRSLSLPSRRPRSLHSLPVALALSPHFPSPSLSPLLFRRPYSLPSLSVALALPSLSVALALSPPFSLPSLQLIPPSPMPLPSPYHSADFAHADLLSFLLHYL
ncbi:unnamed protein product, partial [Closterium sp. Naga37s-1]